MIVGLAGPCDPKALAAHLDPVDAARAPSAGRGAPLEHLANALLALGHRVVVYTLAPEGPASLRLSGPNLAIHMAPYRPRHRMRDLFAAERRHLEAAMAQEPPDILHVHWGYENALAAAAAGVAPVLLTVHDWAPAILRWQPSLYRLGRLFMYGLALRRVRWLAANSPYVGGKLRRWFGRDCMVVPDGLGPDAVCPQPRRFPGGPPVLVAANQGFSRLKNVSALLAAFPAIRAALPEARLRLLGYGHERGGPAEQWARARGLAEGVEFIGQVPAGQVLAHFAQAHLMVHPSQEEAFGHVLMEAMGQGTPVVAAAEAPAPSWLLGHGGNGVLAACRSPKSIAEACLGLLRDPEHWERTARAGWERVRRDFTMDRVVRDYLDLYRSILAAHGVTEHQP